MVFVENLFYMNRAFFGFWGYFFVFVILFLESIPFFGAFVPGGTILLLLSGLLARFGFFSLWKILLVAFFASVTIDITGYLWGRGVNKDFLHKYVKFLLVKKELLERMGKIVHGHTGKALVLGRLNPVTRSIAPFLVGNEHVGFWKFFFWNVVGGALWVTLFIFLGYIFGGSFEVMKAAEAYIVGGTILIAGGFYGYYIFGLLRHGTEKIRCILKSDGIECKK
jgi:membrane-associated protein